MTSILIICDKECICVVIFQIEAVVFPGPDKFMKFLKNVICLDKSKKELIFRISMQKSLASDNQPRENQKNKYLRLFYSEKL